LGSATFAGSAILVVGIGKLGDKWKKSGAIFVSLLLTFISISIFISPIDLLVLAFVSFLMGASYTIWSMMSAVIGSLTPEASRGRWMAVAQTASLLAAFPAPYIGGIFYEASPYNPFMAAIIATPLLAVSALIILLKEGT
jgi:predicted MFS family arabinose efflux permease